MICLQHQQDFIGEATYWLNKFIVLIFLGGNPKEGLYKMELLTFSCLKQKGSSFA